MQFKWGCNNNLSENKWKQVQFMTVGCRAASVITSVQPIQMLQVLSISKYWSSLFFAGYLHTSQQP